MITTGRAGSGGGGRSSSSGHSSPSRSSSGHRPSGGGFGGGSRPRAGSGGSSFSGGGYRPSHSSYRPPPPPPPRPSYGRRRGYGYGYGGYSHNTTYVSRPASTKSIIAAGIVLVVLLLLSFALRNGGGSNQTVEMTGLGREKLKASVSWNGNCVVDEIDYINNERATATGLKEFYDKTGIQPFAVFKSYDSSLKTDDQKQKYAEDWYEANIDNEATVLYMYFEDTDTSVPGYMSLVGGSQTKVLWDDIASNKFWDFIDMYWAMDESQMTTDKLITLSFVNTGKFLMDKGKITVSESHGLVGTISKVIPFLIVAAVIVIVLLIVFKILKWKRAQQKAENEETAAILNAPLDTADHSVDDLVDKYK